jgi:hypothetical protein
VVSTETSCLKIEGIKNTTVKKQLNINMRLTHNKSETKNKKFRLVKVETNNEECTKSEDFVHIDNLECEEVSEHHDP